MMKKEFIQTLQRNLSFLPMQERQEIINDYEEHFRQGMASGRTEEEICFSLGDPSVIVQEYAEEFRRRGDNATMPNINIVQEPIKKGRSVAGKIVMASLLILGNLCIALPIICSVFGVLIAFLAVGVSLVIAGIVSIVAIVQGWIYIFVALLLIALGGLLIIGMVVLMRLFFKAVVSYTKANIRWVKGE